MSEQYYATTPCDECKGDGYTERDVSDEVRGTYAVAEVCDKCCGLKKLPVCPASGKPVQVYKSRVKGRFTAFECDDLECEDCTEVTRCEECERWVPSDDLAPKVADNVDDFDLCDPCHRDVCKEHECCPGCGWGRGPGGCGCADD